jgi:Nucleotidyl transferase AbiEii toxin, Type IV TA system
VTSGAEIFDLLQRRARSNAAKTGRPAPTSEYLLRHLLESFLDRLTKTEHVDDFVLKGGILLAVYGVRRPTKDIDAAAVSAAVTPEHLREVVGNIATVAADDGVQFDLDAIIVQEIRDEAEYRGLRLRVPATIGPWKGVAAWDVSTGDPITPAPRLVSLPRILGGVVEIVGYRPETTIAEKGVTILERGTTSTRWRDYVDIVQLFEHYEIDRDERLCCIR